MEKLRSFNLHSVCVCVCVCVVCVCVCVCVLCACVCECGMFKLVTSSIASLFPLHCFLSLIPRLPPQEPGNEATASCCSMHTGNVCTNG